MKHDRRQRRRSKCKVQSTEGTDARAHTTPVSAHAQWTGTEKLSTQKEETHKNHTLKETNP